MQQWDSARLALSASTAGTVEGYAGLVRVECTRAGVASLLRRARIGGRARALTKRVLLLEGFGARRHAAVSLTADARGSKVALASAGRGRELLGVPG